MFFNVIQKLLRDEYKSICAAVFVWRAGFKLLYHSHEWQHRNFAISLGLKSIWKCRISHLGISVTLIFMGPKSGWKLFHKFNGNSGMNESIIIGTIEMESKKVCEQNFFKRKSWVVTVTAKWFTTN